MYGFYTFAIRDILIFPEGGNPLTIEQLIKEHVHTLHMAARELENTVSTNRST